MHVLGGEVRYLDLGPLGIAPKDVAHAKAGQRFTAAIAEDWRGLLHWVRQRSEQEVCSNLVYQRGLIEVEKAAHRC
jgi:hypothetical protein